MFLRTENPVLMTFHHQLEFVSVHQDDSSRAVCSTTASLLLYPSLMSWLCTKALLFTQRSIVLSLGK